MELLQAVAGLISAVYERYQSQLEIQKSEQNYRSIFEQIGDMVIVSDMQQHIVYANSAAALRLGYSEGELTGRSMLALASPDMRERLKQAYAADSLSVQESQPVALMKKDGGELTVVSRLWKGVWNRKPCLITIQTDVSEQQSALELFNRLFMFNPVSMVLCRASDNTVVEVNNAFEEVFGFTRSEIAGRTCIEAGLYAHTEQALAAIRELGREKIIHNRQMELRRKDGRQLDILYSGVQLPIGTLLHNLAVFIDITEQNRMRESLRRQKARLEYLIAASKTGIWEWEIPTGRLIVSEAWAAISGYTPDEFQLESGHTFWESLIHSEDRVRVQYQLDQHFAGRSEVYECEYRLLHRGGYWIWVAGQGRVFEWDQDKNPLVMYGTQIDVSRRKAEELQLRETMKKALVGAEEKTIYLAQISHEIRTPLNIIMGFNDLLLHTDVTVQQRTYLHKIRHACRNLLEALENILEFSAPGAHPETDGMQLLDIAGLFSELADLFSSRLSADVQLEIRIDPAFPDAVTGDLVNLHLVLRNLLSNAVKFTSQGSISLKADLLGISGSEVRVLFTVSDTGIGISPEDRQRIFDPFIQVDAELDRSYSGSGLGLSVCRSIVESMGGRITVESVPLQGSTFAVELPFRLSNDTVPHEQAESAGTVMKHLNKRQELTGRLFPTEARQLLISFCEALELADHAAACTVLNELTAGFSGEGQAAELLAAVGEELKTYRYGTALALAQSALRE
jgi:two-component system, sensor histidine kinase and response regulator